MLYKNLLFSILFTISTIFLLPLVYKNVWLRPTPNYLGGTIIFCGFIMLTLGAYLKRPYFQIRLVNILEERIKEAKNMEATTLGLGFIVFGSLFIIGLHIILGPLDTGLKPLMLFTIFLGFIPAIYMEKLFILEKNISSYKLRIATPIVETIANILIYLAIIIVISLVNYFIITGTSPSGISGLIVRIVASIMLFSTFYIPASAPFLFEEFYTQRPILFIEIITIVISITILAIRTSKF